MEVKSNGETLYSFETSSLKKPLSFNTLIYSTWPGYLKVFSFISFIWGIVKIIDLKPSELKDSNVPTLSNSTNSQSVRGGLTIKFPFSTYLAGLVYSSITSIGENGAL